MRFIDCGDMQLFLWMENLLTDAEYYRAIDRFNERLKKEMAKKNKGEEPDFSPTGAKIY